MKNTLLTILLAILSTALVGQSKTHKVSSSSGTLVVSGLNDVQIEAYDGTEIEFSTSDFDNEVDERASGLRLVNSLGLNDNTGMGLATKEENGQLIVSQISSSCDSEFEIRIPRSMMVICENTSNSAGDIVVKDVSKEIIISTTYGDVTLSNITGPMAVKSIYGSIDASFNEVSQEGSISLESVYDIVDVSIPENAKADVSLRTPYGEIYSNVDIEVETSEGMRRVSSKTVKGTVNGGGVEFYVKASYDNIYLRKL